MIADCRLPIRRSRKDPRKEAAKVSSRRISLSGANRQSSIFNRQSAFTLVELLTVIAIMGVLAALILVAVSRSRERARMVQVSTEVRELAKAWKAYWVTYGHQHGWPEIVDGAPPQREQMTGWWMQVLAGQNGKWNPEGIIFMEVKADVLSGGLKDPWDNLYVVDFSSELIEGIETYETAVMFPNRERYEFE